MRRWKRPRREWRAIIGYPMFAALAVGCLVALVRAGAHPYDWFVVPGFLIGLAMLWHMIRLGIYVSNFGIRVIRVLSLQETVAWHEIAMIDVGDSPRRELVIRTLAGEEVRTDMVRCNYSSSVGQTSVPPKSFDRMVMRLRDLHDQATGQVSSIPDTRNGGRSGA
jgi:hypothetical protein